MLQQDCLSLAHEVPKEPQVFSRVSAHLLLKLSGLASHSLQQDCPDLADQVTEEP